MCCIIIAEGRTVDWQTLKDAAAANPDGLGIAWVDESGTVRWWKGCNIGQVWILSQRIPRPYMIHARLATVGGRDSQLAHPFPIMRKPRLALQGTSRRLLMHNGHVPGWQEMLAEVGGLKVPQKEPRGWSDTRAVAHCVAVAGEKEVFGLPNTKGDRFAILDPSRRVRYWGHWHKDDGLLLSSLPGFSIGAWTGGWRDYTPRREAWPSARPVVTVEEEDEDGWVKGLDGLWRHPSFPAEH